MTSNMTHRIARDTMSLVMTGLKLMLSAMMMIFSVLFFIWTGWAVDAPRFIITNGGFVAITIGTIGWLLMPSPRAGSKYEKMYQQLGRHQISWTAW